MRWLIIVVIIAIFNTSAFAEGIGGWLNMNYNNTEQFEDGKKTSTSDSFFQNYYLRLDKTITPMLSYQLYFRTSLTDSHLTDFTDSEGYTTDTYQRAMEPALDIALRNPMYGLNAGYRRTERWSTAHLRNESRGTTEFYYSRLNITPYKFPSLSLQFDRQGNYDHLATRKIDNTTTGYSGNSSYALTYNDLRLSYGLTYTRNINETPIGIISKSINDSLNGMYSLGYSKSFWNGRVNVSAGYQGNYGRNESTQFATQTGTVLFERKPFGGLHDQGTALQPNVDNMLPSLGSLVDDDYNTGVINISNIGQEYHNVGIWVLSEKSVDRLYIYVNKDVRSDTNLTNPSNWKVYKSNFNQLLTWTTEIPILSVVVSAYDALNNIYLYEIKFSTPQSASYFKALNMKTVNAPGITDVLVTEIEAYGTEVVSQTGELTDVTTFFTQGLNLNANLKATNRLSFSFNYFMNKADQNPESIVNSMSGIFANIISKSKVGQEEKLRSNITRSYGATSTWMAHRLLTTILRLQRSEAFDNKSETDFSSNTYSLAFSSSPLPTLDTNLSLIRSESYSFDEKQSVNNSYLLSLGSRLYTNVNMITDMGYTQSKSYATDTRSSARYISGALDARLTRKLYGSLTYGFSWTSSGSTSSSSKDGGVILSYNLSRLVNFSGNFRISDTGGIRTTSEGFLVDWLPLPVVRLNLNYQHSTSKPDPLVSDSLSGYGIWYIMKFMDVRITYSYTLNKDEKKTETYNLGGNLTCRFW